MATKSILKNITIREKHLSRTLISALENAQDKPCKNVEYSKRVVELKGNKIKDLFGVNK